MKKPTKIVFSLLLMLVLLVSTMPLTAIPAFAATNVYDEEELNEAIESGQDITISEDIFLEDTVVIPEGKDITIDLSGCSLDRGLDYEVQEGGSVIKVESGASLTIKDNSGTNSGTITGGASYYGGGICNYGDLTVQAGTISGNSALHDTYGGGGGIYNCGTLTLQGGVITENEARYGGGVTNATGKTMTIQSSVYKKKVGKKITEIPMNPQITNNYADDGRSHGLINNGTLYLQGSPEIYDNEDNDIYVSYGKKIIINGELSNEEPIGIRVGGTNPVVTSGFSEYNSGAPEDFFKSTDSKASLKLNSDGEIMLKNDNKTTVVVYENNTATKTEEYTSVSDAWEKVKSYAKNDSFKTRVEITLGTDWTEDEHLTIDTGMYIVVDLNGHYIKRNRNGSAADYGCLFDVGYDTHFVIKDSNPDAKGYDGLKGGVLTGGYSTNTGGCINLHKGAWFEMTGGTIYQCNSNLDGGAVRAYDSDIKLSLSNCSLRECNSDKGGGGVYFNDSSKELLMDNVTVRDCYAGQLGGAVLFEGTNNATVRIKNSLFNNNNSQAGGALALFKVDNNLSGSYVDFIVDNCRFYNNYVQYTGKLTYTTSLGNKEYTTKALKFYGSAVFLSEGGPTETSSSGNQYPILFRDCEFKYNRIQPMEKSDEYYSRYGSPFYIKQNGLVLDGCTITNNSGAEAPVYVENNCVISLQGKTTIKDNDNGGVNLQGYAAGSAMIYDAGLTEDSYIDVQAGGRSRSYSYVLNVPEYHSKYFHYSDGDFIFNQTGTETAKLETASVFGEGSLTAVCVMLALMAAAVIITVIVMKKKRGGAENVGTK